MNRAGAAARRGPRLLPRIARHKFPVMLNGKTILLIVTGGIAAYKSLILIRRLREGGATVRTVLTAAGEKFVTPLSVSALSHETSLHRHVLADRRGGDGPSAPVPGGRSGRRRPGHRRYPRQDGGRAGGRSGEHRPARRRCADAGRAGDEPSHVAASGDHGEHGGAGGPRRAAHRAERRIAGRRRERARPDGRAGGNPRRRRSGSGQRRAAAARRPPRAGHQRADLRGDRSRPLPRQPLVRQAGPCNCRGAGGSGCRDCAGRRPGGSARSGRGRDRPCRKRTGYAGGLRSRPAGGHPGLCRRRFGLAGPGRWPTAK